MFAKKVKSKKERKKKTQETNPSASAVRLSHVELNEGIGPTVHTRNLPAMPASTTNTKPDTLTARAKTGEKSNHKPQTTKKKKRTF